MASTATTRLRLQKQGAGENRGTWGTKDNLNLDLIDEAISGVKSLSTTGGTTTLVSTDYESDETRPSMLRVSGTLASAATVLYPDDVVGRFFVANATSGAYTLTVGSDVSTLAILQGCGQWIWLDGTGNCYAASAPVTLSTGTLPTGAIADNAITQAKMADNSVGTAEILDSNVTTAKILDSNVTTAKIANDAVTYAKIQNVSATDKILGRASSGAGDVEEIACTAAGRALLDDVDAAAQRATLGLVIGTDVQAYDADLAALSGLASAADKLGYFTGPQAMAVTDFTPFARTLVDDVDATTARATLGVVIGTNVQAYDATLQSLSALGTTADRLAYTTGADTWAETALTSFGRSLIDDADASAARTTLGLVIGTNVQAHLGYTPVNKAGDTFSSDFVLTRTSNNALTLPVSLKNAGTAGAGQAVGMDFDPTNNGVGVRSGQILFETNGSNVLTMRIKLSNAGAPADALVMSPSTITYYGNALINVAGNQTLTGGFNATSFNAGTKSSGTFTPNPLQGNLQYATNGGAHTLAPPATDCSIVVQYTNNGSAGTITTSSFTKVSGTAPGTVNGDDFKAYIVRVNGFSHLTWVALQ